MMTSDYKLGLLCGGLTLAIALQGTEALGQDPGKVRTAAKTAGLGSLNGVPIPGPDLIGTAVVVNDRALLRLGKALFWDMQAGSDGQACGTCHFHAGADSRSRNQLSPGLRAVPQDTVFGNNTLAGSVPGFPQFKPDYQLAATDFPFHKLQVPEQENFIGRVVLQDTNDVVSSMGVFAANFVTVIPGVPIDVGTAFADATFHRGPTSIGTNVRRVEPRNTPSVNNAVFNHSNFWDGRAHNLFNGVSVIGPLDPNARIWVNKSGTGSAPVQETVRFPNSSLASQAVGPPTSDLEMSFFNRPFPMVGRKLLHLTPLGLQLVDQTDSVLGPLSRFPNRGLNATYSALISAAFASKYWNGANVTIGGQIFSQMEANFTLFWGLAVQRYEQQLVSDRSPFDRFMEGSNTALTPAQLKGLLVFINRGPGRNTPEVDAAITALGAPIGAGNCVSCHGGPEFTEAAFTSLAGELIEQEDTTALVGGLLQATATQGLLDKGFSNIGVRPNNDDPGRGGMEGGFPLSFVQQALNPALNFLLSDLGGAADLLPCTVLHNCPSRLQVNGAFKIPGLRNAELTGPYFHNGGQATLTQVLEFYDRQGDFGDVNIVNVDQNLAFVNISDEDEPSLLAFLRSLTDERVRQEKAPFDHPEIFVSRGGTVLEVLILPPIVVPRVGAGGRPAAGLPPLGTFLGLEP